MTHIKDIIDFTESFAPLDTAADFDNVGLLAGSYDTVVSKVLVALDITPEVVEEAVKEGAQLIISHHPIIFNPLKNLPSTSVAYLLAQNSLSALCLHTNLDIAEDTGVNYCLAKALELENITFFEGEFLVMAELSCAITAQEFAKICKRVLGSEYVTCTLGEKKVKKVGMCSGAGGSELLLAKEKGADVFLTGEAHHHNYLESFAQEIPLVVAGHFETEDVVIAPLVKKLGKKFCDVEFLKSAVLKSPLKFI